MFMEVVTVITTRIKITTKENKTEFIIRENKIELIIRDSKKEDISNKSSLKQSLKSINLNLNNTQILTQEYHPKILSLSPPNLKIHINNLLLIIMSQNIPTLNNKSNSMTHQRLSCADKVVVENSILIVF